MGLTEKLTARAARQGRSAPVVCGELGTVTVEALPVRELELLLRGADGQRAVFYAACRELQRAGEELRKAGQVFAPDGIMQFVSDGEAEAAARTVLELSGQTAQNNVDRIVRDTSENQNRLPFVQEKKQPQKPEICRAGEQTRLAHVQYGDGDDQLADENRLAPVQFNGAAIPGFGQVSRETGAETAGFDTVPEADKKAQALGILPPKRTQNVVTEEDISLVRDGPSGAPGDGLHETESELGEGLHENKSEFRGETPEAVHETMSEFPDGLHETESEFLKPLHESKSDFGETRRKIPHELKSEFRDDLYESTSEPGGAMHEITSDFRQSLHEMTSGFPKKDRAALHETTSELAEAVARRLVEGLRRAKWVRGD